MTGLRSSDRYSAASVALHWLMLLLLVAVYACIELRVYAERGSELREGLKTWHFMLGLSVFALVWLRLVARLVGGAPPIVPTPAPWQRIAASLVHLLLYALMIVMPLLGWLTLSAEGETIPFFGLELPALVAPDEARAEWFEARHEQIGTIGYWLIGLHALAALMHHYLHRDSTLRRMLPGRK